jgi:hypothetical protein
MTSSRTLIVSAPSPLTGEGVVAQQRRMRVKQLPLRVQVMRGTYFVGAQHTSTLIRASLTRSPPSPARGEGGACIGIARHARPWAGYPREQRAPVFVIVIPAKAGIPTRVASALDPRSASAVGNDRRALTLGFVLVSDKARRLRQIHLAAGQVGQMMTPIRCGGGRTRAAPTQQLLALPLTPTIFSPRQGGHEGAVASSQGRVTH